MHNQSSFQSTFVEQKWEIQCMGVRSAAVFVRVKTKTVAGKDN